MKNINENNTTVLIEFIAEFCQIPESEITIETRLRQDLGIDGDDASDFMVAFGDKFHVDLSKFNFDDYFFDELVILRWIIYKLLSPEKLNKKEIKVNDLLSAINRGCW